MKERKTTLSVRGKGSGNLPPPESLIPAANLPPVSLMPMVHLDLRISPRIKKKSNGLIEIIRGLGEDDPQKDRNKKALATVLLSEQPLALPLRCRIFWLEQIFYVNLNHSCLVARQVFLI